MRVTSCNICCCLIVISPQSHVKKMFPTVGANEVEARMDKCTMKEVQLLEEI